MTLRSSVSRGLLVDPSGIAIDADGDLLVADRNAVGVSDNSLDGPGGVIGIDPAMGRQERGIGSGLVYGPGLWFVLTTSANTVKRSNRRLKMDF